MVLGPVLLPPRVSVRAVLAPSVPVPVLTGLLKVEFVKVSAPLPLLRRVAPPVLEATVPVPIWMRRFVLSPVPM